MFGSDILVLHAALLSENEVGREEFLLLTDDDIAIMVKPIGARRKLINMRKMHSLESPVSHIPIASCDVKITLYTCLLHAQKIISQQSGSHAAQLTCR